MYGRTFDGKWHYTKNNLSKCCMYLKIIEHSVFTSNPTKMCNECLQYKRNSSFDNYDTSIDVGIDVVHMEIEDMGNPNTEVPKNQTNTLVSMGFVPAPNPIASFDLWKI